MGKVSQENIVGQNIGIYKVLYECDHKSNDGHRMFHVKCNQCGWETDKQMHQIKYSTRCRHTDRFGNYIDVNFQWQNKRIGHIFRDMKTRCYTTTDKDYKYWGAKGIRICQEWLDNPKTFENWALSNGYADDLTIDRIDESKNYCPENCHWVTLSYNAKHKSTTNEIEVDEVTHTGSEWPLLLGLGRNTINTMLRKYDEELVKEFIRRRLANPNLTRRSHQTWMNVYNLE